MDLAQMKATVTMEGVLSGTAALELIAEVERLTALCDGYRGEVAGLHDIIAEHSAEVERLKGKLGGSVSALTRARAEGMEEAIKAVRLLWPDTPMGNKYATPFIEAIRAAAIRARATKGDSDEG